MKLLGQNPTREELNKIIEEVDVDGKQERFHKKYSLIFFILIFIRKTFLFKKMSFKFHDAKSISQHRDILS